MPITYKAGPGDAVKVIAQNLAARGKGTVDIGAPLQCHVLPLHADRQDRPLSEAAATLNWYYPITGGIVHLKARYIVADVPGSAVSTIITGAEAVRLGQAQALAERQLGSGAANYQPRFLTISSLRPKFNITALWLSGSQNHFIALSGTPALAAAPLKMADDIRPVIMEAAQGTAAPFITPPQVRRKRGSKPG